MTAGLFQRVVGSGPPLIILHGGPDFDHTYLLPELDRLADVFRLIYYDQRGRGQSAASVQPEEITLQSEVEDLEALRQSLHLDSVSLLGHSWGALLALEYALQHPQRVTHLILLNPAPVSRADYLLLRESRITNSAADIAQLRQLAQQPAYRAGDPEAVAEYYRVHFHAALPNAEHLERIVTRLRASFTRAGILKARAIEKRLLAETWLAPEYDLLARLDSLSIRTLIIRGEFEFIPLECAAHIAEALPNAQLITLKDCGHFSYLEQPEAVQTTLNAFLQADQR